MEPELHHVGLACRSIASELAALAALGAVPEGDPFADAGLGIRGQFVLLGTGRIELLEELDGSGVLAPWLRGGSRFYHLAYEVADLGLAIEEMAAGAKVVRAPRPAVAFDGREVAFLITPTLVLVELIQRP